MAQKIMKAVDKPKIEYQRGTTPQKPVDTSGIKTKKKPDANFNYDQIAQNAEDTNNPDGFKYQAAVEMAKQLAGEGTNDKEMRKLVDSEFAKLNPTYTGEQMRGEDDLVSKAIGGANDLIDNGSKGIGWLADQAWDLVPANLAGLIGGGADLLFNGGKGDWGKQAHDTVSKVIGNDEDDVFSADTIGDIGMDLMLSAIPGAGLPLLLAKQGIQDADDIKEAATGRDSITLEQLDTGQKVAKAGSTLLDLALTAIPAIGKARNAGAANLAMKSSNGSLDDAAENIANMAKSGKLPKIMDELSPSNLIDTTVNRASNSLKKLPLKNGDAVDYNTLESLIGIGRQNADDVAAAVSGKTAGKVAKKTFADRASDIAQTALHPIKNNAAGKVAKAAGDNIKGGLVNAAIPAIGGTGMAALSDYAENGGSLIDSFERVGDRMKNNPSESMKYLTAALLLGKTPFGGGRLPNPNGAMPKIGNLVTSASRAKEMGRVGKEGAEKAEMPGMTYEEMLKWLEKGDE